jgi:hypothetical protein
LFVIAPVASRGALLFVLAVLLGCSSTISSVVLRTSVPDIVGVQARARANGLLVTGRSLAMVCGFAAAGVIVGFTGYTAAFIVDAATFLISAMNLALLPLAGRAGQDMSDPGRPVDWPMTGITTGMWVAWTPLLIGLVLVRAVDNFGSASHQVGMPIYARIIDPANAAAYVGQFWACWAVGSLLAHQFVTRALGGRALGERAFMIGTCLMSALFILVFVGLPWPLPLVVALAAGLADGFTQIMYDSRLQALPGAQRGRMLSLAAATESSALGAGMVLSASLLDVYSPTAVVTGMHGTAIALAVCYLAWLMWNSTTSSTAPGTSTAAAAVVVDAARPGDREPINRDQVQR